MWLQGGLLFAQLDTTSLKKRVTSINTAREHFEFWEYIHNRDQELRRSSAILQIDQENLIQVAYYLNLFGYPDPAIAGKKSSIINYVWIHNRSFELKKITFPIIHQAYLSQTINEKDLREYFLRVLYQRYFDDGGNYSRPLGTIFKELEVNLSGRINIPELMDMLVNYNKFIEEKKDTIGIWRSANYLDTFLVANKKIIKKIQGNTAMIYKSEDHKIYFMNVYKDSSYDPAELVEVNDKGTYRNKERVTTDYYQITREGDLKYWDDEGRRVITYFKL